MATQQQRQTRERRHLEHFRMLHPGEVDAEIDGEQLATAPVPVWDSATQTACATLYERYVLSQDRLAHPALIPDAAFCDLPRWVFLEYVTRFRNLLLVGSQQPDHTRLEPVVLSQNVHGWNALHYHAFAHSSEALFHALLDNDRLRALDCGTKSTLTLAHSGTSELPGFYFGIDYRALPHAPWRPGTVYLYARADFPPDYQTVPFHTETPPKPLAKLRVYPRDWPLLDRVLGVNVVAQTARQRETFRGYPWTRDICIHPHGDRRSPAEQARTYLDIHYAEPIDLPRLGRYLGLSPFTVLRVFRAHIGLSPREYQTLRRVEQAKRLLRAGQSIARIAAETGFTDQSHLHHHFQQIVGMTPGRYQRVQESPIPSLPTSPTLAAGSTR